ncbi:competence protein ComK [Microbacteriaceae bacterium 4G12]
MSYVVNRICSQTMALVPYAHTRYQTMICREDGNFYSTLSCTELLEDACHRTGSSTKGKREAIKACLQFKQNIPIPLHYEKNICAIPSQSPDKWECTWYFYAYIKDIRPQDKKTVLIFHNNSELLIDSSVYHTKQQLLKAARILTHFKISSQG